MEKFEHMPPIPPDPPVGGVFIRRIKPNENSAGGVQIIDPESKTRVEIMAGLEEGSELLLMIRPEFVGFLMELGGDDE